MAEEAWPRPRNYRPFSEDTAMQVDQQQAKQAADDHKGIPYNLMKTETTGTLTKFKRKGQDTWETLPERKKGGPVKKGKQYLVGEEGPEVFVPKQSGKIKPNKKKLRRMGAKKAQREIPGMRMMG